MFKPVKLSTFLAKQKLLGTGIRIGEYLELVLDNNTSIAICDFVDSDEKITLKIKSVADELKVADYFTELDVDVNKYDMAFVIRKTDIYGVDTQSDTSKTKVSLRGVKIPKELVIIKVDADEVDFGDDIDITYQFNHDIYLPEIKSIEKDLTFNKEIASKKLKNTGVMYKVLEYSTSALGVSEMTLSCLTTVAESCFEDLHTLDLSSVHKLILDLGLPTYMYVWHHKLREVKVSKELAYIMIQLLTHTSILMGKHFRIVSSEKNIWLDNSLKLNTFGVYQLGFGVKRGKSMFEGLDVYTLDRVINKDDLQKDEWGNIIQAIYDIEETSARKYKELLENKEVVIGATMVVLSDE